MSRTVKKPYPNKAKQIDKTCRSHGGCPYCTASKTLYKKLGKELDEAAVDDIIASN